jgi:hypothetical protein
MATASLTPAASPAVRWTAHIIVGLVTLFMVFDSTIKLLKLQPVIDSFVQLGYDPAVARGIGLLELIFTLLYVLPRTSLLGAVLLTGVFGGAIASHLRVGDPVFTHLLFGVYLGGLMWIGLLLRDRRVRELFFGTR